MNILLTGATGTLGSRVLFSLLEENLNRITCIYLPVRKKTNVTPETRIQNMLSSAHAPEFIQKNQVEIKKRITVIDATKILEPSSFLENNSIDYFIHSAGYVNLSTDPNAKEEVFKENFEFTKAIFQTYSNFISKFVYISTAFSFGDIGGTLSNNYHENASGNYRNYYEASKHESEKFLLEASKQNGIPVQILRPSVLGGNIEEMPNLFISKYMVFYLFAKFFNNSTSDEAIRINTNCNTGLNIIPTDYAAKVIVKVFETSIEQLNIVHTKETNMMKGISKILHVVGFSNFTFTNEQISTATGFATKLEQFYYETIGFHLDPYMTSKPNEWDTTLLESILPIPNYNLEEYLSETVAFAKAKGFRNQKW